MDLEIILHFVFANIEKILVVLVLLFIVTSVLLIIRGLKEKPEETNSGLDVRSVEGALKRVLAQNPVTVAASPSADGAAPSNLADLAPLKTALAEKEKQLAALNDELTEAKAQAAAATASSGSGSASQAGPSQESAHAMAALEMEIADLKAKLAEYEIIEDDIADLALYKEENARLKREIEEARAGGGSADVPPIVEANPAAGIPGLTEALQEEAAAAPQVQAQAQPAPSPTPAPAAPAPPPVAEQPAAAPQAPVDALGKLDTDKMMLEAETLATKPANEDEPEINALSDLLDTDKLLEEVNSLDAQDVMSEFKDKSKLG